MPPKTAEFLREKSIKIHGFPRFSECSPLVVGVNVSTAGMMPPNSVQDTCLLLTSFFVCMICVVFWTLTRNSQLDVDFVGFFLGGKGCFFNKRIFQRSVALICFVCFVLSVVYDEVQRQGYETCQMHPGQQVRASHSCI